MFLKKKKKKRYYTNQVKHPIKSREKSRRKPTYRHSLPPTSPAVEGVFCNNMENKVELGQEGVVLGN